MPLRCHLEQHYGTASLERRLFKLNRTYALGCWLSMIFFVQPVTTCADHALGSVVVSRSVVALYLCQLHSCLPHLRQFQERRTRVQPWRVRSCDARQTPLGAGRDLPPYSSTDEARKSDIEKRSRAMERHASGKNATTMGVSIGKRTFNVHGPRARRDRREVFRANPGIVHRSRNAIAR